MSIICFAEAHIPKNITTISQFTNISANLFNLFRTRWRSYLNYTKTSRSTYIFVSAHSKLISFIGYFPNCLFVKPKFVNQGGIFLLFERAKLSLLFKAHQHFMCNHRMLFMPYAKTAINVAITIKCSKCNIP